MLMRPTAVTVHALGWYSGSAGGVVDISLADRIVVPPELMASSNDRGGGSVGRWADGAVLLVPPSFQINALPTLQAHVDVSELFDPKGAVGAGSGARGKWREALLAATRGVTDEEPVGFGNASVVCAVHEYFKIDPETWNAWLWVLLRHPDSVSARDGGVEGAGRCGWGGRCTAS